MEKILAVMIMLISIILSVAIADDSAFEKSIQATLEKAGMSGISTNVKVINSQPTSIKGIKIVSLRQPDGFQLPALISDDGKTIIGVSELLISSDENFKNTLKKVYEDTTKYNEGIRETNVLSIFKKYVGEVIRLSGKNSKKTTYMVVDPTCQYCHAEIQKLEDTLEKSNVELLVVGALGIAATNKAASFYQDYTNLKDKKSQKATITLLKRVFDKSFKVKENIDTSKISTIGRELFQAGVNAVPYIIEK